MEAQRDLETLTALIERVVQPAERARLETERLRLLDERRRVLDEQARQSCDQRIRLVTGLVTGLGPLIAAGIAAWIVWRTSASERALTRSAQMAERFTRAVDQLGKPGRDHLDVRLGGIYALEQIAKDDLAEGDPAYRGAVTEVLTAFVRGHAPRQPEHARTDADAVLADPSFDTPDPPSGQDGKASDDRPLAELRIRAADVQAAMTVLGRPPEGRQPGRLDLHGVDLRRAHLPTVHLEDAYLSRAHLQDAYLPRAHLEGADLSQAHLDGADLSGARLDGADLSGAHLDGTTDLSQAHLEGADLSGARLDGADLSGARLDGADLSGADLKRGKLVGAHLVMKAKLFGANLEDADLSEADLGDAFLSGARMQGAILHGAKLQRAHMLRAAYLQGARDDAATTWPDDFDEEHRRAAGISRLGITILKKEVVPTPTPKGARWRRRSWRRTREP